MTGWLIIDELEMTYKKAVVAYLNHHPLIGLQKLKIITKTMKTIGILAEIRNVPENKSMECWSLHQPAGLGSYGH
jgi:hypothetical protein